MIFLSSPVFLGIADGSDCGYGVGRRLRLLPALVKAQRLQPFIVRLSPATEPLGPVVAVVREKGIKLLALLIRSIGTLRTDPDMRC